MLWGTTGRIGLPEEFDFTRFDDSALGCGASAPVLAPEDDAAYVAAVLSHLAPTDPRGEDSPTRSGHSRDRDSPYLPAARQAGQSGVSASLAGVSRAQAGGPSVVAGRAYETAIMCITGNQCPETA